MKHMLLLPIIVFFSLNTNAQSSIVSSGGNAFGTGGSAGISAGQIAYKYSTSATGDSTGGLQQAFAIYTLGTDIFPTITLEMSLYPVPTSTIVTLKITDLSTENLNYQLLDISGQNITAAKILNTETQIDLSNLHAAIYFLKISDANKIVKTFKLIKN